MPNTPEEIGQLIKHIRKEKGLTQTELGEKLGVTKTTIALYEKGHNNFTVTTLARISEALASKLTITITP